MYNDIDKIFEEMREAVHNGPVAIKELKEAGRPVIGTYCTFTPWELINAAGGISVSGGSPRKDRTPGRSHSITSSMSALAARSTTLCAVGEMFGVLLPPAGSEAGGQ